MIPSSDECRMMVGGMVSSAQRAALEAVKGLNGTSSAQDMAKAEVALRKAADILKRAQVFLSQWP